MQIKKYRSKYADRIVIRFIISYLLVILVSILVSVGLYNVAINSMEKEAYQGSQATLSIAQETIENELQKITSYTNQIVSSPRLQQLSQIYVLRPSAYLEQVKLIKEISSLSLNLDYLDKTFIYFNKVDRFLTDQTVYETRTYHDQALGLPSQDFDTWMENLNNPEYFYKFLPPDTITLHSSGFFPPSLYYINPLFGSGKQEDLGVAVATVQLSHLESILSHIDLREEGFLYIADKHGNIILNPEDQEVSIDAITKADTEDVGSLRMKIGSSDMLVSYITSDYNDWTYVVGLPYNIVMAQVKRFQTIATIAIILFGLLGIVVTSFFTFHTLNPVIDIAHTLDRDSSGKTPDSIKILTRTIPQLLGQNQSLSQIVERQNPVILSAYLEKVLRGTVVRSSDWEAAKLWLGLESDNQYLVLLCRVLGEKQPEVVLAEPTVESLLLQKSAARDLFHLHLAEPPILEVDYQTFAILLAIPPNDEQYLDHVDYALEYITQEIFSQYNIRTQVGVSEVNSQLPTLWQSYDHALEALGHKKITPALSATVQWYDDMPKDNHVYYFPVELEQQLMQFVLNGETEQATNLLTYIYNENFEQRSISVGMTKHLMAELKSTLVKLCTQITGDLDWYLENKIDPNGNTPEENFEIANDLLVRLSKQQQEDLESPVDDTVYQISQFIQENYSDPDLGLTMLAEEFDLSESYLSRLFREKSGFRLGDFIEQIRIREAFHLLNDTDLNINVISEEVGYNSPQSFRRAFKRLFGVTPTQARSSSPKESDKEL